MDDRAGREAMRRRLEQLSRWIGDQRDHSQLSEWVKEADMLEEMLNED